MQKKEFPKILREHKCKCDGFLNFKNLCSVEFHNLCELFSFYTDSIHLQSSLDNNIKKMLKKYVRRKLCRRFLIFSLGVGVMIIWGSIEFHNIFKFISFRTVSISFSFQANVNLNTSNNISSSSSLSVPNVAIDSWNASRRQACIPYLMDDLEKVFIFYGLSRLSNQQEKSAFILCYITP